MSQVYASSTASQTAISAGDTVSAAQSVCHGSCTKHITRLTLNSEQLDITLCIYSMNSSGLTYRVNNVVHDDVSSLLLAASQHVHQICHMRWRAVSVRNCMPRHIKAADRYRGHVLSSLFLVQALEHAEVMVIMDHK